MIRTHLVAFSSPGQVQCKAVQLDKLSLFSLFSPPTNTNPSESLHPLKCRRLRWSGSIWGKVYTPIKLITKVNYKAFINPTRSALSITVRWYVMVQEHQPVEISFELWDCCCPLHQPRCILPSAPRYGRSEAGSIFKSQIRVESLKASHDTDWSPWPSSPQAFPWSIKSCVTRGVIVLPCVASVVSKAGSAQSGLSVLFPHKPLLRCDFHPASCRLQLVGWTAWVRPLQPPCFQAPQLHVLLVKAIYCTLSLYITGYIDKYSK